MENDEWFRKKPPTLEEKRPSDRAKSSPSRRTLNFNLRTDEIIVKTNKPQLNQPCPQLGPYQIKDPQFARARIACAITKYCNETGIVVNFGSFLGEGSYGKVISANFDGVPVAIKGVEIDTEEGVSPSVIKEVSVLKEIGNLKTSYANYKRELREALGRPVVTEQDYKQLVSKFKEFSLYYGIDNVMQVIDAVVSTKYGIVCVVMERMDHNFTSLLLGSVRKKQTIDLGARINVFRQMLNGISFLHRLEIYHLDLKPDNIMIKNGIVKIIDFGLIEMRRDKKKPREVVTLWWRAPEILLMSDQNYESALDMKGDDKGLEYDAGAVDVWALGCIFAEIVECTVTGDPFTAKFTDPFFYGDSEVGQLMKIFQKLGTPDETTWPGVSEYGQWNPLFPKFPGFDWNYLLPHASAMEIDLLSKMLTLDPSKRITAADALNHALFNLIPDPQREGLPKSVVDLPKPRQKSIQDPLAPYLVSYPVQEKETELNVVPTLETLKISPAIDRQPKRHKSVEDAPRADFTFLTPIARIPLRPIADPSNPSNNPPRIMTLKAEEEDLESLDSPRNPFDSAKSRLGNERDGQDKKNKKNGKKGKKSDDDDTCSIQ